MQRLKQVFRVLRVSGHRHTLTGWREVVFLSISLVMVMYQIWSVAFSTIDPMQQMAVHLSFILVLTFFLNHVSTNKWISLMDGLFILLAASSGIYYTIHAQRFATRIVGVDPLTNLDIIFGLIFVLLSLEAARRTIGNVIVFLAIGFCMYALYGDIFSGIWYHHGMSWTDLLEQFAFSYNGLWGSPISVAATFVFVFVLFGAFLQASGTSDFFYHISVSIAGRSKGGAAKIAVLASAFSGMISGSPTANVVTTGSFTIPMSKKLGYSSRFAAAIEAIASTGGSLLPPIMGSAAFLMAAVTSISYSMIIVAALLPAILFYISLLAVVHFEALRLDLPRMDKKEIPKFLDVMKKGWYHLIPVIILVFLLMRGASPSKAGLYGIVAIVVIYLLRSGFRKTFRMIRSAVEIGIQSAIPISTACAVAGIIIAGIMTTGLGGKLNSMVLGLTAGHFVPTLFLIMGISIILGMGMPVAATYVLTAMLAAPTLIHLGVSVMASHLFIVYFAVLSAITPPVAVAAFAAAGIAGANPNKVGLEALRLALPSFVIPFVFVFNSALLMEGNFWEIVGSFFVSSLGVIVLSSSMIGYFVTKLSILHRMIFFVVGILILYPNRISHVIGCLFVAVILWMQKRERKRTRIVEDTGVAFYDFNKSG